MNIAYATIDMQVQHQEKQVHRREERLHLWSDGSSGGRADNDTDQLRHAFLHRLSVDRVDLSQAAKFAAETGRETEGSDVLAGSPETSETNAITAKDIWDELSPRERTALILLDRLFGFKISVVDVRLGSAGSRSPGVEVSDAATPTDDARPRLSSGIEYSYSESYREQESLSVAIRGTIRTADGVDIDFAVELGLSREFYEEHHVRLSFGDKRPVDPLVINYAGPAADLAGGTFQFDLDNNGQEEALPLLRPGSGFLALDRNGDGTINSGIELFGPSTGDGFEELARYDEDGNMWIDANDPIYDQLRIWVPDEHGEGRLFALGAVGIGAIYVGSIDAPFTYKTARNESLAQNTSAGLFVRNNGTVGTVQQLDFFV